MRPPDCGQALTTRGDIARRGGPNRVQGPCTRSADATGGARAGAPRISLSQAARLGRPRLRAVSVVVLCAGLPRDALAERVAARAVVSGELRWVGALLG